jgi:pimeloyl-ACP methyl ester carboxylesterase
MTNHLAVAGNVDGSHRAETTGERRYGDEVNSTRVTFDDVVLDCQIDGPTDGPLAICLHGFPDTRETFRFLAPELHDLGYRTVLPSMRGYAPSSTANDDNYSTSALASDALRLHEHFGGDENAVLIGHDWGASATYGALNADPTRWRRAVTMGVPPVGSMLEAFSTYDQLKMSWYMWLFQLPLADFMVPLNDFAFISQLWNDWSPSYDGTEEVDRVRTSLAQAPNTVAALTYYRQMFDDTPRRESQRAIFDARLSSPTVPTLYLHGDECGCIARENFSNPLDYLAPGSQFELIGSAGHFVHLEQPRVVNALIANWLAR